MTVAPLADPPAPPFEILAPARQTLPVVVASPHSGRRYSQCFLRQTRLGLSALRRSEDSFTDELVAAAPRLGAPLIRALFPRTLIDVNREPFELDPAMFAEPLPRYVNATSPRVRCGLGTIPRLAASGAEIYRAPLSRAEARRRLRDLYLPYHKALRRLLVETRSRFGFAVLIDCHSMPSQAALGERPAWPGGTPAPGVDVVLGDGHGTSCMAAVSDRAERLLGDMGYAVGRNRPYAGGFTIVHYGRPEAGVHALQLEVNRGLYMDEARFERRPSFGQVAADLGRLIAGLGAVVPYARAAE